MVICFICKDLVQLKSLRNHFNFKHTGYELEQYKCCEGNCKRSFQIFSSYKRHLQKCHVSEAEYLPLNLVQNNDPNALKLQPLDVAVQQNNEIIDQLSHPSGSSCNLIPAANSIDYVLSTFIASLYANTLLPRSAVQKIVEGLDECLISLIPVVEQCVNKVLVEQSDNVSSSVLKSLSNELETSISTSLNSFNTERKRLNYYQKQGSYVKPESIVVGQRVDRVRNQGITRLQPKECHVQFIPLREVLKRFFSLDHILPEMLEYMNSLKNKLEKENFIQGSYWKKRTNYHGDKIVIPLFLFFDDYETGNVLGSHAGVHKLGAVYISIACLPPWRAAALSNIFLLQLFHSSDRVAFGNQAIFRPVITELNYLNETGIFMDISTFKGNLYFELGVILGDNLGLHSMLGLVESFSANFACRVCKVAKNTLKEQFYEDKDLLRKMDSYSAELALNDPSMTGIKERCVFLDIKDFDLFQQVGVDIMHDILEGVAKYLISFMLLEYTQKLKLFSLSTLNNKLAYMDFGPDCKNRPCSIEKEHLVRRTLRCSSGEMLTLLRFLGIMVGSYVPRDNTIWMLYIKLRKILDIVLSAKVSDGTEDLLQILVAEFNELYMKITKDSLKPKFHNMIHYHTALEKFGPLYSLWSMRFEGKHRHSKMAANTSCNHVNVSLTLTMRHQLQLNEVFYRGSVENSLKLGPKKNMLPSEACSIQTTLNLDSSKSLVCVNWAMISTIRYKKGCILVHSLQNDAYTYIFLEVENVYMYDGNNLIFSGSLLETVAFDEHYFAYQLNTRATNVHCDVFYKSLLSPIPNTKNVLLDGKQYVVLRSPL